jgi:TonB family protein
MFDATRASLLVVSTLVVCAGLVGRLAALTGPVPSLPVAQAATGEQAPRKIEVAVPEGMKPPSVIREVKPQYSAEAERRGIQGTVVLECVVQADGKVGSARVVESLDAKFGLDEQALKAARQWRFKPGTKDGASVPVLVKIEMTFKLTGGPVSRPVPLAWPDAFPSKAEVQKPAAEWTTVSLETDGLRATLALPRGWQLQEAASAAVPDWFNVVSPDFSRLLVVSRPVSTDLRPAQRLTDQQLRGRLQDMASRFQQAGSLAVIHGAGQEKIGGLLWEWTDYAAPAGDPEVPPRFRSRAFGSKGRVRIWHFTASSGTQLVDVVLRAACDGGMEENVRLERQAAADLAAVLASLSFKSR